MKGLEKDMKKKIITAVLLSMVLCAGLLTACGGSDEDSEGTGDSDTLSRQVKVVAYEGVGSNVLKNIDGDYKVRTYDQLPDVEKKIKSGDYDVAVLPTTSAGRMYGKTGRKLVEISPASMNGIYLLSNDYYLDENAKISALATKTIYVSGEDSTAVRVFEYLMSEAGMDSSSYKLKVLDSYGEIRKALADYGNIALASQPYATNLMKKNDQVVKLMDLNERFKEDTNLDIPTDVVIAKKSFAEKHDSDLRVFLKDYKKANDKTRQPGQQVFYSNTNRGITILKEFNDAMYSYNSAIFDGRSLKNGLYYQQ
jgi:hypothetical protein